MFDYSFKPKTSEVEVNLFTEQAANAERGKYTESLSHSAKRFGFEYHQVDSIYNRRPKGLVLRHLIYQTAQCFNEKSVRNVERALRYYDSVSIIFEYSSLDEMLSYAEQIEALKKEFKDKVNFLRPDVVEDGRYKVSLQKVADNSVCDTVRVKYNPLRVEEEVNLSDSEKYFFEEASRLYTDRRMFLRAPSDGYFAIRRSNGFLITATKTVKTHFEPSRVCHVKGFDVSTNTLTYSGIYLPSSDAVEASVVFLKDPSVVTIVHTHASDLFTRNPMYQDRIRVRMLPYGEPLLGYELSEALRDNGEFTIMEEHGEIFIGRKLSKFDGGVTELIANYCDESVRQSKRRAQEATIAA